MRRYFDKGAGGLFLCFIKGKCVDYQLYAFWKSECLISCCIRSVDWRALQQQSGYKWACLLVRSGGLRAGGSVGSAMAVSVRILRQACDHHKQLIQNLYESMSTKEWMAVRKLNVLGFASVQERAAAWLLQETDASDTVVLKTNREEQADYLCVARPSLSRTLMQMQKAGLIEADRKQIRILDREKLGKNFVKKKKFVTAVTDFF